MWKIYSFSYILKQEMLKLLFLEKVQKNVVGFQNMFLWVPL